MYHYSMSNLASCVSGVSTTIVTSPRAVLNSPVPPNMPKCPSPPTLGGGTTPPNMICPLLSKTEVIRHCKSVSCGGTLKNVQIPTPVPTSLSCSSNMTTLLMNWSPILGLLGVPMNVDSTILAITWMVVDWASARVETRAMPNTASAKKRVMCVPPHQMVSRQLRRCRIISQMTSALTELSVTMLYV